MSLRLVGALIGTKGTLTLYKFETSFVKDLLDQTKHRRKLREDDDLLGLVAPMVNDVHKFNDFANLCGITVRGIDILGNNLTRAAVRILGIRKAKCSLSRDSNTWRLHLLDETKLAL